MAASASREESLLMLMDMFAGFDRDVIQIVLDANNGHLERTTNALLDMQPRADSSSGNAAATPGPATAPASATSASDSESSIRLPDDFLRAPSYFRQSRLSRQSRSQIEEDETLARFMQDQIFLDGLMQNPSLLETSDYNWMQNEPSSRNQPTNSGGVADAPALNRMSSDSMREKISSLGTAAKRKLSKLVNRLKQRSSGGMEERRRSGSGFQTVEEPQDYVQFMSLADTVDSHHSEEEETAPGSLPMSKRDINMRNKQ